MPAGLFRAFSKSFRRQARPTAQGTRFYAERLTDLIAEVRDRTDAHAAQTRLQRAADNILKKGKNVLK